MKQATYLYIDRTGRRIDHGEWLKRLSDESYCTVKEFDNGQVNVRLRWVGKLNRLQAQSFRDTWPVFAARVMNYKEDGSLAADPVDDGRTFHDEESALDWYEEFLTTWTESFINEDGKLAEVDNHLAPPPPPDPDAPTSTLKDAPEDFGAAW